MLFIFKRWWEVFELNRVIFLLFVVFLETFNIILGDGHCFHFLPWKWIRRWIFPPIVMCRMRPIILLRLILLRFILILKYPDLLRHYCSLLLLLFYVKIISWGLIHYFWSFYRIGYLIFLWCVFFLNFAWLGEGLGLFVFWIGGWVGKV